MAFKIPMTHYFKTIMAATTLVLCWIVGLRSSHQADDAHLNAGPASPKPKLGLPFLTHHDQSDGYDAYKSSTPPAQTDDAFCSHYHLKVHNGTVEKDGLPMPKWPRKVYDLILVTPTTSLDALELHLAHMYPFVDFIVVFEATTTKPLSSGPLSKPEWLKFKRDDQGRASSGSSNTDGPSALDTVWNTRFSPYHGKSIRRHLSRASSDFATGKDQQAAMRNAVYSQVVPLLSGPEAAELDDVLVFSDAEELVRPDVMRVLRECAIPNRVTIKTRRYWHSFQWFKIDALEAPSPDDMPAEHVLSEGYPGTVYAKMPKQAGPDGASREWWSHPQVTLYKGPETTLPDELRKERGKDEYVFGSGGWTCHLCSGTISDTLAKAGEMGLIWHNGPRWKSVGRVTDRMSKGIDMFDRTKLSRIGSNPDIPPYLQINPHRFPWMLDRDSHDANFIDFDEADFAQYLSKKKEVDAEKDVKDGEESHQVWNLDNTQAWNDPEFAPPAEDGGVQPNKDGSGDDDTSREDGEDQGSNDLPGMSEEDRLYLEKLKEKPSSELTDREKAILEQLGTSSGTFD